ncbi:hypothetical protein Lesp02_58180 [Lentzea sp. NBRC 105346]|uniref:Tat pathway signal sequence domain protein n=1 Tax=Lentzea sp. NBRC 105346 TaxID=3032205 RepID=UPI0024A38489|nr:Tat pathway signal sequence domain protein [Lentzea sp. NBRC 105346]GLZ33630.1 hypothetical protein Lesp02_58180 [Lentzea sp. NBRC 105346]
MSVLSRRDAVKMGAGAVLLGGLASTARPAYADPVIQAGWALKWSPDPAKDGLQAFEGLEDDRAGSHKGVKHIYVEGDHWRFDMHTRDRDGSDRQRNESKGMRSGGSVHKINKDETWKITWQAFWPSALTATTKFTHIHQMKVQDVGGPLWTITPRMKGGTPTLTILTLRDNDANTEHTLGSYSALQNKWIDIELDFKASNSGGHLHWVIKDAGKVVVDGRTTAVDLWRDKNYLRPKWGIYRSLGSSGLRDCYQLIRNYKGYKWE